MDTKANGKTDGAAEMTPREIDLILSALWERSERLVMAMMRTEQSLKSGWIKLPNAVAEAEAELTANKAALAALNAEAKPYEAEYTARRWNRYFLVTNGNGHVHRERSCSTCYPTTRYAWLPVLSGCDEAVAVAEYGEQMCTVCFPNAPVLAAAMGPSRTTRERNEAKAARQAKREAAAAKVAAKAIANPDGTPLRGERGERIYTEHEAKGLLTDLTATMMVFKSYATGSYVDERKAEYLSALDRVAEALAAKQGRPVAEVKAEAVKKATKRGC